MFSTDNQSDEVRCSKCVLMFIAALILCGQTTDWIPEIEYHKMSSHLDLTTVQCGFWWYAVKQIVSFLRACQYLLMTGSLIQTLLYFDVLISEHHLHGGTDLASKTPSILVLLCFGKIKENIKLIYLLHTIISFSYLTA